MPPADVPPPAVAGCVGVVKVYWTVSGEVHALKGVDASFPAGSVTAVVGPSGSGKSSLLRILAGLDEPTAGVVSVGGHGLSGLSVRRRRRLRRRLVGYVFQRPSDNLIGHFSAREHLEHAAVVRGAGDPAAVAERLLRDLALTARAHHRPAQLSGGEQQRLAFARAVAGEPALIVADEPTAELDEGSAGTLLRSVHRLSTAVTAVVLSTHDPAVVAAADRVLILRHGALQAETAASRRLSVIDAAGRVQLPAEVLGWFPQRRATLEVGERHIRILPPGEAP